MPSQYEPSKIIPNNQMIDPAYTQEQLDAIHTRSVNSFFCPVCSMVHCRVIVASQDGPYEQWIYECGFCKITGTKSYIEHTRFCSVCGRALNEWNHCPTGCVDSTIAQAIIRAYAKPAPQIQPVARCPMCYCEVGACEHTAPIVGMSDEHILHGEA